ncbi:MAG: helix-turn-helix domain-containing protein [Elusimicrobia bacterium]|nr:helix-turn-helix domain-containing protein [Elusimicrobiota bacterium]
MREEAPAFSRLVTDAMQRRGLGLRELCRRAKLDPSFLSKVLAGKRNPPAEEDALRRIAAVLETDAVELFVAAGRIPEEWRSLKSNPELLRRVDAMMHSGQPRKPTPLPLRVVPAPRSSTPLPFSPKPFNEELL